MNRLADRRPRLPVIALSRPWMKWVSALLLLLGLLSATLLQRGVLRMDETSLAVLSEAMKPGGGMMGWVTLTVLCSLISAVALPIYAKLLLEGWENTSSLSRYALSIGICALVSEPCYDFAMTGRWLDMTSQDPVWGVLLALAMLEILKRYSTTGGLDVVIKTAVTAAALIWSLLLRVRWGPALILLCAVLYIFREVKGFRYLLAVVVTLIHFPAPLGLLFVKWYDGEKESRLPAPKWFFYGYYPAALLLCGAVTAAIL